MMIIYVWVCLKNIGFTLHLATLMGERDNKLLDF